MSFPISIACCRMVSSFSRIRLSNTLSVDALVGVLLVAFGFVCVASCVREVSFSSMGPSPVRSHRDDKYSHFEYMSSISNESLLIHVLSPCGVMPILFANCALLPLE